MKSRSFFVVGIILVCSFGGFLGISIFSNLKLRDLQEAQSKLSNLLLIWKKSQNLTRELLITYDLIETRRKWLNVNKQFDEDFLSFLHSPLTIGSIEHDTDFQIQIAMIEMRWKIIQKRLREANNQFERYVYSNNDNSNSGNLLVDFGENLVTRKHSENLMNLLKELRWCTSLSDYAFTEALTRVSKFLNEKIKMQTNSLRLKSLLVSFSILGTGALFILFRMVEMTRSREKAREHATELSIEIDERKRAEEMLRSERDKLRGVLDAMGEGLYIVNRDFIIEYQNDIVAKQYGEVVGTKCFGKYLKSTTPCDFCALKKTIASGEIHQTEAVLGDGREHELIFSSFSDVDGEVKVIVFKRDITEKKRFQAESMRAGHLAAIGELAAGVAHEINNPINGIINYAERLETEYHKNRLDPDIPARIIKEGDRIARIVKNLLSFARDRNEEYSPACLKDILGEALGLVEKQMTKSGINLRVDLGPDLPMIKVRSQEIQQVFLNIISNARYALNKKYPKPHENKALEINGQEIKIDGQEFVRVSFHDKGPGIPKEIVNKICNPFFTTKPKGEGTGLGLSISHGIVKSHGGRLTFVTAPEKYTTVIVDLPAVENHELNW